MSTLSESELLKALSWRYATKKFDPSKRIPEATWETLRKAASLTASSFGLEPYRVVEIRDPKVRATLQQAAYNQTQVVEASHFIVLAIEKGFGEAQIEGFLRRSVRDRQVTLESLAGYKGYMEGALVKGPRAATIDAWSTHQVYILLGNLLTSAALAGVDACPMEGIDTAKFDEILGLKEKGLTSVAAAAFGYRSSEDKYAQLPKVRKTLDELFLTV
ncbi:MAG TPA: NAD(P)H-dependent oxidoreductase [Fibrobacteria bacterium]|nr:NAD(P)H-dependent oxidoreductase [Fibrobacteria bacterium]